MNAVGRLAAGLYARMLRLYLRRFRAEFEAEMRAVFAEALTVAARQGARATLGVCLRELWDLPFALLREHWATARNAKPHVSTPHAVYNPSAEGLLLQAGPGTWAEAAGAAAPYLLLAAMLFPFGLLGVYGGSPAYSAISAGLPWVFGLLMVIALFLAGRRGWPRWWASWSVFWFVAAGGLMAQASQGWNTLARQTFQGVYLSLAAPLLAAGWLLWVSRRHPISGLLAAMPLTLLLWMPFLEFVPELLKDWVVLGAFLLGAAATAAIVRVNNVHHGVWLTLCASLLVGAPMVYIRTYAHVVLPEYPLTPTVTEWIQGFIPQWLSSATIILGPLLAWAVWQLGHSGGRAGRLATSLVIAGAALNLVGHITYAWWPGGRFVVPSVWIMLGDVWPTQLVGLGLLAALAGALWLVVEAWRKRIPLGSLWGILLGVVMLALPLMIMPPTYMGSRVIPAGLWFGLYDLGALSQDLVFAIGVVWLLMAGALFTHLSTLVASARAGEPA